MIKKYAIAMAAIAALAVSLPANAEEVGVGVGVGPVGPGVTVGESHRNYDGVARRSSRNGTNHGRK